MRTIRKCGMFGLLLAAISAGLLFSQNPGVSRTVVHKADISVPGREAVIARAEISAGAHIGRHSHPGEEMSYVIEGAGDLMIDGQPTRAIKAGDGFVVPNGAIHDVMNTGTAMLKIAAIYAVEKGKPLATPAP